METTQQPSKTSGIKFRDKIGYAFGDTASLFLFGLVQSVLQKYYTDVLSIGIVQIMLMFIVARVWDAVNDPLWGRIIDQRQPKEKERGRYLPWLKILAVPTALSAVLMFIKIPGLTSTQYLIYAYITYILFGMMYTGINIPYGSLAQVITSDDRERSSLSIFRSVGSTFGALPAMILISFCYVKTATGNVMSYPKIIIGVLIIAALSVVFYLLCYRNTTERVVTAPKKTQKGHIFPLLKMLIKSRPYIAICIVGMFFLATQMFTQTYYPYLFDYYFNAPQFSMAPMICTYLPVAVIMFFAGKLGNKFGRRDICAYGMLVAGLFNLFLYISGTHSVWFFLITLLFSGIGNAFLFLLVWALATDAIDFNRTKYGIEDEATSYAIFTFMRKLGQTVAAILVNVALLRIGYTDNVLNTSNITAKTLNGMYAYAVLIPAILFILIFLILRFLYPLGKKQMDALREEHKAA